MNAERKRRERTPFLTQLPLLIGLVALWLALWGVVDVISVVTGIVCAVLVLQVFYLPPVELSGRFHLGWTIVLFFRIIWWLISSSFQIAWLAVRPQKVPKSSIIAIRMRTHSDWLLTVAAEINMLVPGSVVVEVDRLRGVLFLHVLDAGTEEKIEEGRRGSFRIEEAVVRALGSREDIWRINRDNEAHGRKRIISTRRQREFEQHAEKVRRELEKEWEEQL